MSDISQLQQDYAALDTRLHRLEAPVTLAQLQVEYAALGVRVSSLENTLLTPSRLKFVGGYRIPAAMNGSQSMAFSHCGITGRSEAGSLRIWMVHHANTTAVAEFTVPAARGTNLTRPLAEWPVASHVRNIHNVYKELTDIDSTCQLYAVHWDKQKNRLLASGRSVYNTIGGKEKWLVELEVGSVPKVYPATAPGGSQQVLGGGFCDIPKAFADAYCGGNTTGLGKGGYESGQGSSHAPSLAAYGASPLKTLMYSAWATAKQNHERRDNKYNSGDVSWQPQPDGDIGYWGTSRCMDVSWVKTANCDSYIAIALQPVGTLSYALQNEVFTVNTQRMLYVYDPKDLAKVAQGSLAANQVRGKWYPFPRIHSSLWNPKGMWWDTDREVLSVVYANAWQISGPEWLPMVCEYKII